MTTASERREKERRERPSEAETKRYLEIIEEKVKPKLRQYIEGPEGYRMANVAELQESSNKGYVGVHIEWEASE